MCFVLCFFFFKQKTAYEMRISDWSSDVCSSDLHHRLHPRQWHDLPEGTRLDPVRQRARQLVDRCARIRALLLPVRYLLLLAASLDAPAAGLSLDSQAPSSFGVTQPADDAVRPPAGELGRASCRERVWTYV